MALPPLPENPPSSLIIVSWDPLGSNLGHGLFPLNREITITASQVAGDYELAWTNGARASRSMTLSWSDGSLSGSEVKIQDSDGTPLMTVPKVDISLVKSRWQGDLTGPVEPGGPGGVGNTGTFVAQAATGGPPPDDEPKA